MMEEAEQDVLGSHVLPDGAPRQDALDQPIERRNSEPKCLTEAINIFPNEGARWDVKRSRDLPLQIIAPEGDDPVIDLPAVAS